MRGSTPGWPRGQRRRVRSVGALIREAVDHMWTGADIRKAGLPDEILADGPMPVPDPADLALELEEIRGSRFLNS